MDQEDQLAELFGRWKGALDAGRPMTPEEVCSGTPQLLDEFRRLLPQLAAVDALFQPHAKGDTVESLRIEADGYRSVSFHKQGGLGVVLVGEDVELRRTVALKRLQSRFAVDASARARFVAEAEVTARLDHPGVVPVYRMGRDATGQPFYAMRFIQGETLGAAIRAFHEGKKAEAVKGRADHSARNLEFRRLVRALIGVCETAAYAHSRGVIHRDLKPDNIMLGQFGETVVLDWGLAKRMDQPLPEADAGGDAPTLPEGIEPTIEGKAKGSPAFMSPEQARGEWSRVGPAGDVYSLGSTLYVVLTGRMPYAGETALEIVEKVRGGRFEPPGQVASGIPQDLDAVCRKAMAFEPADRYADARALAADLERWLADEPVTARREPLRERARRWLRRHRTAAGMGVTALVLTIIAVAATALQQNRLVEQERATVRQLTEARSLTRKLAFATRPGLQRGLPEQFGALADVRRHFEHQIKTGDSDSLFELGILEIHEGVLRRDAGDFNGARSSLERAAGVYELSLRRSPTDLDMMLSLVCTRLDLAAVNMASGNFREAIVGFQQALVGIEELKRGGADYPFLRWLKIRVDYGKAISHGGQAEVAEREERVDEALGHYKTAYEEWKRLEPAEADLIEFAKGFELFLRAYLKVLMPAAKQAGEAVEKDGKKSREALELYEAADNVVSDLFRRSWFAGDTLANLSQAKDGLAFATRAFLHSDEGKMIPAAERRSLAAKALAGLDVATDQLRFDSKFGILKQDLKVIAEDVDM